MPSPQVDPKRPCKPDRFLAPYRLYLGILDTTKSKTVTQRNMLQHRYQDFTSLVPSLDINAEKKGRRTFSFAKDIQYRSYFYFPGLPNIRRQSHLPERPGHVEEWSSTSCKKFHKDNALHLGQHTHRAQQRPGSVWQGSGLAEGSLGAMEDRKLNRGQQCNAGGWDRGKLEPRLHLQGQYQWRQKCNRPTLLNSCQATHGVLCLGLVPAAQ